MAIKPIFVGWANYAINGNAFRNAWSVLDLIAADGTTVIDTVYPAVGSQTTGSNNYGLNSDTDPSINPNCMYFCIDMDGMDHLSVLGTSLDLEKNVAEYYRIRYVDSQRRDFHPVVALPIKKLRRWPVDVDHGNGYPDYSDYPTYGEGMGGVEYLHLPDYLIPAHAWDNTKGSILISGLPTKFTPNQQVTVTAKLINANEATPITLLISSSNGAYVVSNASNTLSTTEREKPTTTTEIGAETQQTSSVATFTVKAPATGLSNITVTILGNGGGYAPQVFAVSVAEEVAVGTIAIIATSGQAGTHKVNDVMPLVVELKDSALIDPFTVTVTSMTPNVATVTPATFQLSSDSAIGNLVATCVAAGDASIKLTYSDVRYAQQTIDFVVDALPVVGTISVTGFVASVIESDTTKTVTLKLDNSVGIDPFTAVISSSDPSIVVVTQPSGSLSTLSNTITFTVDPIAVGDATVAINFSDSNYPAKLLNISVTPIVYGTMLASGNSANLNVGTDNEVTLTLTGSQGLIAPVTATVVSSDPTIATVTQAAGTFNTANAVRKFKVKPLKDGVATITVSFDNVNYPNITYPITVVAKPTYGNNQLVLETVGTVNVGSTINLKAKLVGSANVAPFNVTLNCSNNKATLSTTTISLSSATPEVTFSVTGVSVGAVTINAIFSALVGSGYSNLNKNITVTQGVTAGTMNYATPDGLIFGDLEKSRVDLSLVGSAGVNVFAATITSSNPKVAIPSQAKMALGSTKPTGSFNILPVSVGTATITVNFLGNYAPVVLEVEVVHTVTDGDFIPTCDITKCSVGDVKVIECGLYNSKFVDLFDVVVSTADSAVLATTIDTYKLGSSSSFKRFVFNAMSVGTTTITITPSNSVYKAESYVIEVTPSKPVNKDVTTYPVRNNKYVTPNSKAASKVYYDFGSGSNWKVV